MKVVKKGFAVMACLTILFSVSMGAHATEAETLGGPSVVTQSEIQARADVYTTCYRYHPDNGRMQYRTWNTTRGCWVESNWIYL